MPSDMECCYYPWLALQCISVLLCGFVYNSLKTRTLFSFIYILPYFQLVKCWMVSFIPKSLKLFITATFIIAANTVQW